MENGEPTEDSMIAYNIYNSLEQAGYRTFFAKKSLESKLGQEYEPYIYAALMSATVMIVLGTKTEYYNSTWVKNEWSRFLELKKENKHKTLIACFKNMSPYEMPMEFSAFQSFDLNKIGYVEYLVEGVNHVIQNSKRKNGVLPNEETSEVNRLAANAETFMRLNETQKAYELYIEMQNRYPEDYRGWWGVPYVQSERLTRLDNELASEMQNMVQHAITVANPDKAKMIQEEWKDYIRRLQEQNKRLKISEAEEEKNNYQNQIAGYSDVSLEISQKREQTKMLQLQLNELKPNIEKLSKPHDFRLSIIVYIVCGLFYFVTGGILNGVCSSIAILIIWGIYYAVVSHIEPLIKMPMLWKKQKEYDDIALKKQKIESCIADLGKQKETYETCVNKIRELEDYIQELRG